MGKTLSKTVAVAAVTALLGGAMIAGPAQAGWRDRHEVYGVPEATPISETQGLNPINPYGASKLAVERMLGNFGKAHGLCSVS